MKHLMLSTIYLEHLSTVYLHLQFLQSIQQKLIMFTQTYCLQLIYFLQNWCQSKSQDLLFCSPNFQIPLVWRERERERGLGFRALCHGEVQNNPPSFVAIKTIQIPMT